MSNADEDVVVSLRLELHCSLEKSRQVTVISRRLCPIRMSTVVGLASLQY